MSRDEKRNLSKRIKRVTESKSGGTGMRYTSNIDSREEDASPGPSSSKEPRKRSAKKGKTISLAGEASSSVSAENVTDNCPTAPEAFFCGADPVAAYRMDYLDGIMSGIELKAKIANQQFEKAEAEEEEFRREFSKAKDTWGKRTAALDDLWKANGSKLDKPFVLSKGTLFKESFCDDCYQLIPNGCVIRCTCCKKDRCSGCDHSLHSIKSYAFFHSRILLADHLGFSRQPLKPTDFVDSEGTIFHERIPVPCFIQHGQECKTCGDKSQAAASLRAGEQQVVVIKNNGRFDLYSTNFHCRVCGEFFRHADDEDYVRAGWWPAKPSKHDYFYCQELLLLWHETKFNTPGTSTGKFLENLGEISRQQSRSPVIDKTLFSKASENFDYMRHKVKIDVLLLNLTTCLACGHDPSALHADADFKVMRLKSAKGVESSSVYEDIMFAFDTDVADFIEYVNEELKQAELDAPTKTREHCGGAVYKAAKTASSSMKGLDETALMMISCRHAVVYRALNLHQGETYRHVLYIQEQVCNKMKDDTTTFFCYDVVCQYWKFLISVAEKIDRFKPLVEKMKPFLSRWHGQTHAWYCQLLYMGFMMQGAAATSGEMQEQVNSYISRFGSTTKHMGKARRIDHLTGAILFWNEKKFREMARLILKQFQTAKVRVTQYQTQLQNLLNKRNEDLEKLIVSLKGVIDQEATKAADIRLKIDYISKDKSSALNLQTVSKKEKLEKNLTLSERKQKRFASNLKSLMDERNLTAQNLPKILLVLQREAKACERKRLTAKTPLAVSLKSLEGMRMEIEVLKRKISTHAEKSQQRNRLWRRIKTVKQKVRALLDIVNPQLRKKITEEDFDRGNIGWNSAFRIPFHEDQHLVETWMLSKRYKEEIELSKGELDRYLKSVLAIKEKLSNRLQSTDVEASGLDRASAFLANQEIQRLDEILSTSIVLYRTMVNDESRGLSDNELLDSVLADKTEIDFDYEAEFSDEDEEEKDYVDGNETCDDDEEYGWDDMLLRPEESEETDCSD